jgi:heptosyltransferase-3
LKTLPNKAIPAGFQRVALINPTRYLGNLLLAGGLIQDLAAQCQARDQELLLVLDASFAALCAAAFPGVKVLYYPRQAIAGASLAGKIRLFAALLRQIRGFRADLAFNIEEDTLTSRLTRLSGARFRLGCSPARQRRGYEHVLPVEYAQRPQQQRHRWHSYHEMFAAIGLENAAVKYMNTHIKQCDDAIIKKLLQQGVKPGRPWIVIHPSATKSYKKWPESSFSMLCKLLIQKEIQPLLIGAGKADADNCARLFESVVAELGAGQIRPINLCNQLPLQELAQLFLVCSGIVGNDSGPFHLAAAQGLPGVVIFGPTDAGIWGPLESRSVVMQKNDLCDSRCTRRECHANYRCLQAIQAEEVLDSLQAMIAEATKADVH